MTSEIAEATVGLVEALHRLDAIADANIERSLQIKNQIDSLLSRLEAGEPLTEIVESEPLPLIPTLVTANIDALHDVGATFRKAEAVALRAHGYTIEHIAGLFGVTRQRISAILKA